MSDQRTIMLLDQLTARIEKLEQKFEDEAGMLEYVLQKRLVLNKNGELMWFVEKEKE